jgi:hypothetical protein
LSPLYLAATPCKVVPVSCDSRLVSRCCQISLVTFSRLTYWPTQLTGQGGPLWLAINLWCCIYVAKTLPLRPTLNRLAQCARTRPKQRGRSIVGPKTCMYHCNDLPSSSHKTILDLWGYLTARED